MKKRRVGALALAVVALLGGAVAVRGADLVFPIQITQITIEGNDHVTARDVEKAISLKVGDTLNEQSDLKTSSEGIFALGWFSEVLPEITQDGRVAFHVVENPVVETIEITGNTNEQDVKLLGLTLFRIHTMPTSKIKQILRAHDVRTGRTFRSSDLKDALDGVIASYKDQGYPLVMIGDVKTGSTLSVEIIEGHVAGNRVTGLLTVPADVAMQLIDLPTDKMLRETDLSAVMTRLRASVFFSDVSVTPSAGPTRDSVVLNWVLTERTLVPTPSSINSIVLEGSTQFPADVVRREIGELPSGTSDNYAVLRALESVFDLYIRAGFPMIRFSLPRIEEGVLRLQVDEGVVSEIALNEESTAQRRVLEKTLRIHVGRVLTSNDVLVSYQRLNALGYFDNITIEPQWTDDGVRVSISVSPKSTLGGMNGSLAFDPATGGIVGELSVKQANIFGSGQDVSLSYSRGVDPDGKPAASTWELAYSTLATRTEFDRIGANLYRKAQNVSDAAKEGTGAKGGEYTVIGGEIEFAYPIGDYADLGIAYRHEVGSLVGETATVPVDSVVVSIQDDSTNNPSFPVRGTRRSIALEKAGGFAVGEEYTKLDMTWTRFLPLYDELFSTMDHALAIRLKMGFGDQGLAGAEAYELGGPMTIRGVEGTSVTRMLVANMEYRVKLTDGLTIAAFLDAGADLNRICLSDAPASTGFELGITAAGMFVRLDVAWVLGADASWVPRFDFGFGPMF